MQEKKHEEDEEDEEEDDKEDEQQNGEEDEDDEKEEDNHNTRTKSKDSEKSTPRQVKKVISRKNQTKPEAIDVESNKNKATTGRSLRPRGKKSTDKSETEEENKVTRAAKKKKESTRKSKATKKEDIEESSEDEEEEEEKSKRGRRSNGKSTASAKKGKTSQTRQDLEESSDEEEQEEKSTKAKRGKSKKNGDIDEEDEKNASAKKGKGKKKTPQKFKRGKFNPDIEEVDTCEMLESDSNTIIDYDTVYANNKNLIRAVYVDNYDLLDALLKRDSFLSNIFQRWGPETSFNAVELAFKKNDKRALKLMLDVLKKNQLKMAHEPPISLHEIDTGYVSHYTFGMRVRKVAAARGGREGNNAFVADMKQPHGINNSLEDISRFKFDPELFDLLRLHCGDYETIKLFNNVALSGNLELAAHIANYANKVGGWNIGFLHLEVLTKKKVSELSENIKQVSVSKKTTGLDSITPLHCAAINPNKEILHHLLQISPQSTLGDSKGRKPIHYAACCEKSGPLEVLIDFGVDVNEPDQAKITPLMYASFNGRVDNVKLLLSHERILMNAKQTDRTTAIHLAATYGHVEVLKLFHQKGADLNAKGRQSMTPLILAAAYGHFDCVKFLIENEAKINDKDKIKRNALMMAVRNGNVRIASYLLKHGSDFDKPDSSDNYAIHYAAAYGFPECIDILVQAKANVNVNNSWNLTPLAVAMLKNNFHCVKKLLQIPDIDVNCKDDKGRTLLSQTVLELSKSNFEQLKFLVKEKVIVFTAKLKY